MSLVLLTMSRPPKRKLVDGLGSFRMQATKGNAVPDQGSVALTSQQHRRVTVVAQGRTGGDPARFPV